MSLPSPSLADPRRAEAPVADRLDRALVAVDDGLKAVRAALRSVGPALDDAPLPPSTGRLAPGGVVILTDDGRGVARAVAADLRAMGLVPVRVRHGVGSGEVEGVNLNSSAAVAALVERARDRGAIAAIVHLLPIRVRPSIDPADSPANAPEARGLALLAHGAAEDLVLSARSGGSAVIAATGTGGLALDDPDGLAGLVPALAPGLPGVRLRRVDLAPEGDVEVNAAGVVREVLADDPSPSVGYLDGRRVAPKAAIDEPPRAEPFLLAAPDRPSWIALARALLDWLRHRPDTRPIDLAYTLLLGQPEYPVRVGLVARSCPELGGLLRDAIARMARPEGAAARAWSVAGPSDWLAVEAARRFQDGDSVSVEALFAGRGPRLLHLGPDGRAEPTPTEPTGEGTASPLVRRLAELHEACSRLMGLAITADG